MSQDAAFEICTNLSLDEQGDGCALLPRASQKRLELLVDDFVEEGLLRLVAFILDGEGSVGTGAKRRGEGPEVCLLERVQASGVLVCTGPRARIERLQSFSRTSSPIRTRSCGPLPG
jgi:hypothetical protein